jgi:hypothetical protein
MVIIKDNPELITLAVKAKNENKNKNKKNVRGRKII